MKFLAFLNRSDLLINISVDDSCQPSFFDHFLVDEGSKWYQDVLSYGIYLNLPLTLILSERIGALTSNNSPLWQVVIS